jgi:hypothetical protein
VQGNVPDAQATTNTFWKHKHEALDLGQKERFSALICGMFWLAADLLNQACVDKGTAFLCCCLHQSLALR